MNRTLLTAIAVVLIPIAGACAPSASTSTTSSSAPAATLLPTRAPATAAPAAAASPAAASESSSSGSSASPANSQKVTVKALDTLKFDPNNITVKAGQPVTVTLQNTGAAIHDFALDDGVSTPVKLEEPGGQTGSTTFTIDKPGTYTFYCSQPGHRQAGMVGTIVVQ